MNMQELDISNVPLFATIPPDELAKLVTELQHITYPTGAILMREGEPIDALHMLTEGVATFPPTSPPFSIIFSIRK